MRSVRKPKEEQTQERVFFSVLCNISPVENNQAESQAHNNVTSRKRNKSQREREREKKSVTNLVSLDTNRTWCINAVTPVDSKKGENREKTDERCFDRTHDWKKTQWTNPGNIWRKNSGSFGADLVLIGTSCVGFCVCVCVCVCLSSASCGLWLNDFLPDSVLHIPLLVQRFLSVHFIPISQPQRHLDSKLNQTLMVSWLKPSQRHNAKFKPSCPCMTQWHHNPIWIFEPSDDRRKNSVDTLLKPCVRTKMETCRRLLLVRFIELHVNMVQFIKLDHCGCGCISFISTTRAPLQQHFTHWCFRPNASQIAAMWPNNPTLNSRVQTTLWSKTTPYN